MANETNPCGKGNIVGYTPAGGVKEYSTYDEYRAAGAITPTDVQLKSWSEASVTAHRTATPVQVTPETMYPQLYNKGVQPGEGYRWENGIWIAPGFDSEREYRNNLQAGAERDTIINSNIAAAKVEVAASGRNPDNYHYWSSGKTIVPIPLWAWNDNGATEASRTAIENAKSGAGISVFSAGAGSTTREEVQNLFRQQEVDSKIKSNEWGTGEQFRGVLPDSTIADINAALFVGKQAAKTFFETDQSGNNTGPGGFKFTSVSKFNPGEYAADAVKLGGGLLGAASLVPGNWYNTANYIQRGIGDVAEIAYMGASALPKPVSVPINAGIGFGAAYASTLPFVMSVPYGAQWAVTNPAGVIPKAGEMITGMVNDIWQRELTNPGAVVGTLAGMYEGGKALGYAGGKAAKYSPVDVNFFTKISTGELGKANTYTTLSTKNPFALAPVSKFYGGFAYGEDFAGVTTFRGSPVELMKGTKVGISDMFNVRDAGVTPNPSQLRLLDPFLRDVAKGSADEPFIRASLDLKRYMDISENTLKYEPRQPIGTFKQTGVDPGVQMEVHEILSDSGSIRLGSSSTTDFLGKRFMRDTTASDIDVDIPKRNFADTIERLKVAYGENIQPIEFEGGGKFKLASMIGDEHLISASTVEAHADVRYYNARTLKGTTSRQQTPEYGIESKASRLFDKRYTGIVYTPEAGIRVALNTKKIAADLTDIYAGSRGISKTAYDSGNYKLGRAYERISDDIRKYADSIGEGDVIRTIPEDILKGTYRGKGGGSIFGVGVEYPSAKIGYPVSARVKGVSGATAAIIGVGIGVSEYPLAKPQKPAFLQPAYPVSVNREKTTAYPTGTIKSGDYVSTYPISAKTTGGGPYPVSYPKQATVVSPAPITRYPESIVNPPATYPVSVPKPQTQPLTTNIPVKSLTTPIFGGTVFAGRGARLSPAAPPTRLYPLPDEQTPWYKPKKRHQRGKRFAEVFSLDKYKGMPVPGRLYVKDFRSIAGGKGKRFEEVFGMGMNPIPLPKNMPFPRPRRRKL